MASVNGKGNEMERILELKNVTKIINHKKILKDVSFEIKPGEIVGFLGPNGAGKTTTLRTILGLIHVSSGDVIVAGNTMKTERIKALREVGGIIETPCFYEYLSGMENLYINARIYRKPNKERIDECIRKTGLAEEIHKKVSSYSLGMKQRLGIARAIYNKPSLLILDEPMNGLDPIGIIQLRDILNELSTKEKMGIFISSHLLDEMEKVCTRYIFINKGEIQTENTMYGCNYNVYQVKANTLNMEQLSKLLKEKYPDSILLIRKEELLLRATQIQLQELINDMRETRIEVDSLKLERSGFEQEFINLSMERKIEDDTASLGTK